MYGTHPHVALAENWVIQQNSCQLVLGYVFHGQTNGPSGTVGRYIVSVMPTTRANPLWGGPRRRASFRVGNRPASGKALCV
jgi:hypothetical protein